MLASVKRVVTLDPNEYEAMLARVQALSKEQQENWKEYLSGKDMCNTPVIFKDGKLWNYSIYEQEFVEVRPRPDLIEHAPNKRYIPVSGVAQRIAQGHTTRTAVMEEAAERTGTTFLLKCEYDWVLAQMPPLSEQAIGFEFTGFDGRKKMLAYTHGKLFSYNPLTNDIGGKVEVWEDAFTVVEPSQ